MLACWHFNVSCELALQRERQGLPIHQLIQIASSIVAPSSVTHQLKMKKLDQRKYHFDILNYFQWTIAVSVLTQRIFAMSNSGKKVMFTNNDQKVHLQTDI